ncbi:hypothetical protein [Streptomyces sp. DG1A-41]|uniref:hypothetical protein n=1 Tax=Streptomyces sp. DG1A-41 TaxID=3125779 RepID=UPI0030D12038
MCKDEHIARLTADGTFVRAMGYRRQAVWDIQSSREDPAVLYCAADSGVAVAEVHQTASGPTLHITEDHETGLGFTRRVTPVEGGWLAVTRDRHVLRARRGGEILWDRRLPEALLHTVAASPDGARALVAGNAGAVELDTATGEVLSTLGVDGLPLWAATYLPGGERVLATRNGVIAVFGDDTEKPQWRLDQGEYPKRMWAQDGFLYVVGDGGLKGSRWAGASPAAGGNCCPPPPRTPRSATAWSVSAPTACRSPPTATRTTSSSASWRTCRTTPRR